MNETDLGLTEGMMGSMTANRMEVLNDFGKSIECIGKVVDTLTDLSSVRRLIADPYTWPIEGF